MRNAGAIRRDITIAAVLLAMGGLVGYRKMQLGQAEPYGLRPLPVRVAEATVGEIAAIHEYLGVVESRQSAKISSRIAARVLTVLRDEGDVVMAGDVLVQLDDQDLQDERKAIEAQIRAADATISSLETNFGFWTKEDARDEGLAEKGALSQSETDATANKMATAQSQLAAARDNRQALEHRVAAIEAKLTYTKLTSPLDGLVTLRTVDPGDLASPGQPVMIVEERSALKLAFDAPQEDLSLLEEGLPVRVSAGDRELALTLTHLYPSLDSARMVRAEAALPADQGFQIGSFLPLSVVLAHHRNVVTVPRESLIEPPEGGAAVFVLKNGILEARRVTKLLESGGRFEVEGVEAGEEVVTSTFLGWATLASGLKAEVIR